MHVPGPMHEVHDLYRTNPNRNGNISMMEMNCGTKTTEIPKEIINTENTTPNIKQKYNRYGFKSSTVPSESFETQNSRCDLTDERDHLLDSHIQEVKDSILCLREKFTELYSVDVQKHVIQRHWRPRCCHFLIDSSFFSI